jgi:hypothetical protein
MTIDPAQKPEPRSRAERRRNIQVLLETMQTPSSDPTPGRPRDARPVTSSPRRQSGLTKSDARVGHVVQRWTSLRNGRPVYLSRESKAPSKYTLTIQTRNADGSTSFHEAPEPELVEAHPRDDREPWERRQDKLDLHGSYRELRGVLSSMEQLEPQLFKLVGPLGRQGHRSQAALEWISERMSPRIVVPPWLRAKRPTL